MCRCMCIYIYIEREMYVSIYGVGPEGLQDGAAFTTMNKTVYV